MPRASASRNEREARCTSPGSLRAVREASGEVVGLINNDTHLDLVGTQGFHHVSHGPSHQEGAHVRMQRSRLDLRLQQRVLHDAAQGDAVVGKNVAVVLEVLTELGVPVFVMDSNSHADVRLGLQRIAALLGTPERAAPAWARIDQEMEAARSRVPKMPSEWSASPSCSA